MGKIKYSRSKLLRMKNKILCCASAIIISAAFQLNAQTFPAGFSQVKVATIFYPTSMAFAPDGRIFTTEKSGKVKIIKNGIVLSTPFLSVSVNQTNERGLSSVAIDPNFNTNHFVYIYYTTSSSPIHNRLSRFTANGDVAVAGSEVVLLNFEPCVNSIHNGGGMAFGPDGKLYIAIGNDNVNSNSQDLTNYKGKLLRINSDGSVPSGNPFTGTESAKRIWAYGFRNPWTISIQPGTGKIFVDDVGESTWEEINDATTAGKNFGWPGAEGMSTNPAYTNPVYTYHHGTTGTNDGCAITGGTFFNPSSTNYPPQYNGKYFFIDYCNHWINYLDLSSGVQKFNFATSLPSAGNYIKVGNDGNLYYFSISQNSLYKIIYTNNNAPVITSQPANVTVPQGQPATFNVSASGATPLNYQWRKNAIAISGANSSGYTIASAQPADAGQYSAVVTNSFGSTTSNSASLTVTAFNAKPTAFILTPVSGTFYRSGDSIHFSGNGIDPEDGTIPASGFSWIIEFHHDLHIHPGPFIQPGAKSGVFSSYFGEVTANVFWRIKLIVKDSGGLTDTAFVDVHPVTSTLTLTSQPAGLQLLLDGQPHTTPYSVLAVSGMTRGIDVISPQSTADSVYVFDHWLHGGNASQNIQITDFNATYTAKFKSNGVPVCTASGTILREYWANVTGYSVADVPVNTPPTSTSQLTLFEGPSNVADNYGSRIRGYICPPQTGLYIFWIASDDNSELWLSTNDLSANKIKIASVPGYTSPRQWTKYPSQQSAPVKLLAGTKYYIEAIHKEGAQGDNLAVRWQLPNGVVEAPIPGSRLSPYVPSSTDLIAAKASWKYLDNGTNQGTAWKMPSLYSDATWRTGNAELGYGDGDEATVVSYGGNATSKYITTYFRKTFNVTDVSAITGLELSLVRDDGAVVYLNGIEVYRNNMPAGTILYNTLASTYIDGINESTWLISPVSKSALVTGTNLLAVEIHQSAITSSDISFNLKLKGLTGPIISNDSVFQRSDKIADSRIKLLTTDSVNNSAGDFVLYPNPSTGLFTMEYCNYNVKENSLALEILNSLGQVVYQKQIMKTNGCAKEVIEFDKTIPPGIYIMNVITGESKESRRIILSE